ncbi:unnamed protein product [Cunninghamella blakesleeana]
MKSSSFSSSHDDLNLSHLNEGISSPLTAGSFFSEQNSIPSSAKFFTSNSLPQQIPIPTKSMSATTTMTTSSTPTMKLPPNGGSSQTKRHSLRSSPPSTPILFSNNNNNNNSSSSNTRAFLSSTSNNTIHTSTSSTTNYSLDSTSDRPYSKITQRPQSPTNASIMTNFSNNNNTSTPTSIHKSINALDAKSITMNMEKSTLQMRSAAAAIAAAAAAAANAKYHLNSSSQEEFHIVSPTSPTYYNPSSSVTASSYFGSSISHHPHHPHHHHHHHHPMIHSSSSNGNTSTMNSSNLPHPIHSIYHRQGSFSSISNHPNSSSLSIANSNNSTTSNNINNNNNNNNINSGIQSSIMNSTININNNMNINGNSGIASNNNNSSSDSLWQSLCVRVLPLFNGEGVQCPIEELNDILRQCLTDPISPQLYHNIESLLHDGMFTLNAKMFGVTDEKLLDRLVEQWSFFFTNALPYFEAVFLPLRTDVRYRSSDEADMWNVRNIALQSFRDNVILLQIKRLEDVFNKLFTDFGSSQNPAATAAKMLQMTSLLATAPDHNEEIERVLSNLKANWKIMMTKGDRRGFAGVKKRSRPSPLTG